MPHKGVIQGSEAESLFYVYLFWPQELCFEEHLRTLKFSLKAISFILHTAPWCNMGLSYASSFLCNPDNPMIVTIYIPWHHWFLEKPLKEWPDTLPGYGNQRNVGLACCGRDRSSYLEESFCLGNENKHFNLIVIREVHAMLLSDWKDFAIFSTLK